MASSVHIRPYEPADSASVKAITLTGFAAVSIDAATDRQWPGCLPLSWGERKWRSMQPQLSGHPQDCFVAVADSVVVGYVTTTVVAEEGVGRIGDLAVGPHARDRGVGRQLLEHALAHFRRHGLRLARIATLTHNEIGLHLFPSVGFVEVARQVHFALPLDGDGAHGGAGDEPPQSA